MRDRNLPYLQFNIQLEKSIQRNLKLFENQRITFSRDLSLEFRPYSNHQEVQIFFPRDYRLLRTFCVIQWYFPQNLHFLSYITLEEQTFKWLTNKQRLELKILLSSKENCIKYLYLTERYTSSEIFGNILKNDVKDLLKKLKITRKRYPKPTEKVYRRGPKDKGSRRVDSSISIIAKEISCDVFIQEENKKLERKRKLLHTTLHKILKILENYQTS